MVTSSSCSGSQAISWGQASKNVREEAGPVDSVQEPRSRGPLSPGRDSPQAPEARGPVFTLRDPTREAFYQDQLGNWQAQYKTKTKRSLFKRNPKMFGPMRGCRPKKTPFTSQDLTQLPGLAFHWTCFCLSPASHWTVGLATRPCHSAGNLVCGCPSYAPTVAPHQDLVLQSPGGGASAPGNACCLRTPPSAASAWPPWSPSCSLTPRPVSWPFICLPQ
ncbi:uncharacterized protein LOC124105968 [Marmota monax]|uniref:uncharacterized protein LOC124105968 n=1 Tax=Marmota monax TaxID=9995 RepID=UPI001EB01C26|nr:uncharacterized protein LOC124105968 [Marmota monax]